MQDCVSACGKLEEVDLFEISFNSINFCTCPEGKIYDSEAAACVTINDCYLKGLKIFKLKLEFRRPELFAIYFNIYKS
jgi:hypothetical protein